jgi:hypothetical protein
MKRYKPELALLKSKLQIKFAAEPLTVPPKGQKLGPENLFLIRALGRVLPYVIRQPGFFQQIEEYFSNLLKRYAQPQRVCGDDHRIEDGDPASRYSLFGLSYFPVQLFIGRPL